MPLKQKAFLRSETQNGSNKMFLKIVLDKNVQCNTTIEINQLNMMTQTHEACILKENNFWSI